VVIVITPYLVKPVNANQIVLPTDGYRAPNDLERIIGGQLSAGTTGGDRPKPTMVAPSGAVPAVGAFAPGQAAPFPAAPFNQAPRVAPAPSKPKKGGSAAPGFGF
jgi:pilus assembly protein CpaC